MEKSKVIYDDYNKCPKCGSDNKIRNMINENNYISEVYTTCTNESCKYDGYWDYGFYDIKEYIGY